MPIVAERSSVRYRSLRPDDDAVRARLRELVAIRWRFGYRRLHALLRREGVHMNHKRLPAVRLSASACIAAPGRRAHKPQEAAAALNETLFTSLAHVREALAAWKDDYNTIRPHSAIATSHRQSMPSSAFSRYNGTGRCAHLRASHPVPLHHRAR